MTTVLTAETLQTIGEAMYGSRWKTEVAALLSVDGRRIHQWIDGDRPIPPGIWSELATELRRRGKRAIALADQLSR